MRLLPLLALVFVLAAPAAAQQTPDWAAPGRVPDRSGSSNPFLTECPSGNPEDCLPDPDPEPVPVDGGLALLALAGAGYAVRRLRTA